MARYGGSCASNSNARWERRLIYLNVPQNQKGLPYFGGSVCQSVAVSHKLPPLKKALAASMVEDSAAADFTAALAVPVSAKGLAVERDLLVRKTRRAGRD